MSIVNCKECGGDISNKAQVCPHCGVPEPVPYVNCRECGEIISIDSQFCSYCGISEPIIYDAIPEKYDIIPETYDEVRQLIVDSSNVDVSENGCFIVFFLFCVIAICTWIFG